MTPLYVSRTSKFIFSENILEARHTLVIYQVLTSIVQFGWFYVIVQSIISIVFSSISIVLLVRTYSTSSFVFLLVDNAKAGNLTK